MRKAIAIAVAAIAATVWLALGALSAAPALAVETTICEIEHAMTQACPINHYPARTYEAEGEASIFAVPLELKCKSSITFTTSTAAGAPLEGKVSSFQLLSCVDHSTGTCTTAKIVGAPFTQKTSWTGIDRGKFEIVPASGGSAPKFEFSCGGTVCSYTANPVPMVWVGGPFPSTPLIPPQLDAEFTIKRLSGVCNATAAYGTTLKFTNPTVLYVEHT